MATQIEIARRIATYAHAGQVDKSGQPYIGHPAAVAALVAARGGDQDQIAAAWLHDVFEDTDVTPEQAAEQGIGPRAVAIAVGLTHRPGQPRTDYYLQVASQEGAADVKVADMDHNSDPARRALITDPATRDRLDAKYLFGRSEIARHRANGLGR